MRSGDDLKLYGAGIVSWLTEIRLALDDPSPNRLGLDLTRVMRTRLRIDNFEDLLDRTLNTDLGPLYAELCDLPDVEFDTILSTDGVMTLGTQVYARERYAA